MKADITIVQAVQHLRERGKIVKEVDIVYDKTELTCLCIYEDTTFTHEFGTKHQGHWEVDRVFYQDILLPSALISQKTMDKIDELCQKELQ